MYVLDYLREGRQELNRILLFAINLLKRLAFSPSEGTQQLWAKSIIKHWQLAETLRFINLEFLDKSLRTFDKFENFDHGHDLKLSTNCVNNKEKSYCRSLYWPLFRTSCAKDNDGNMCIRRVCFFLKSRMVGSIAFPYGFLYSPERRTYFISSMLRWRIAQKLLQCFFPDQVIQGL